MAKRKSASKNPAAVALGSLGGRAKVPKGFSSLSPEERKENAKRAAKARWGKKKASLVLAMLLLAPRAWGEWPAYNPASNWYARTLVTCSSSTDPGDCRKHFDEAVRNRCSCYFDGSQTDGVPNGRWWRDSTTGEKFSFLKGFLAGTSLSYPGAEKLNPAQVADLMDYYYEKKENLPVPITALFKELMRVR